MLEVNKWMLSLADRSDVAMIMQVHDELVFEIKADKVDEYIPTINKLMESCVSLDVPLIVEAGVGMNWDEAH